MGNWTPELVWWKLETGLSFYLFFSIFVKMNFFSNDHLWVKLVTTNDSYWILISFSQVLFSDEVSFEICPPRFQFVRRGRGTALRVSDYELRTGHPTKIMMWGCFSFNGIGPLKVIDGSLNSDGYINILQSVLIPQMNEWFGVGGGIFQQDNASCHNSKSTRKFMADNGLNVLKWPANSPNMNPVENLWGIVKRELAKKNNPTKDELLKNVMEIWNGTSVANAIPNLILSMKTRVDMLVKVRGGHTMY